MKGRQQLFAEFSLPIPETDCAHCLTQSFEADLTRLDPGRYAHGPAAQRRWDQVHPIAQVAQA